MKRQTPQSKGGKALVQKYGREYMSQIGKKGQARFQELYERVVVGSTQYGLVRKGTDKLVAVW